METVVVNEKTSPREHHPRQAHHFFDMQQQHEACKLGLWLFLLTEVLLFGGLFCFYVIYRTWYPGLFMQAHHALDIRMGASNTVVLILSSITVALAIRCTQLNQRKWAAINLVLTILFATTFMVIKYFEYSEKIAHGALPGRWYNDLYTVANPHIFFGCYFAMTGLHGIHVLVGMGLLIWVLIRTLKGEFSAQYYYPVELCGLYWHLVDLIWIFLFPLLYLIS